MDKLVRNYEFFRQRLPKDGTIVAVVKANAYGHGANEVAKELSQHGCDFFAVSNVNEAKNLREYGIAGGILLLGHTPAIFVSDLCNNNIIQTIFDYDYAVELDNQAKLLGKRLQIYVKIDSGMGRLGFATNEDELILALKQLSHLDIVGAYTHFSSADCLDSDGMQYTIGQARDFAGLIERLGQRNMHFHRIICSNTAGIGYHTEYNYNGARLGIGLYGLSPSKCIEQLQPIMTLHTTVASIKHHDEGCCIGYGRTYITTKPTTIATVNIGYADGYPRALSNRGYMLIGGKRAPIVGRICMDQTMLDVTGLAVRREDIVTVIGDGISIDEVASIVGTINYELICNVSARVPRVYIKQGKIISIRDNTY